MSIEKPADGKCQEGCGSTDIRFSTALGRFRWVCAECDRRTQDEYAENNYPAED